MLTGKEIASNGIIKGFCEEAIQQQGIDLRINKIGKLTTNGIIYNDKKADLPKVEWIDNEVYVLEEGYYEVELMEGCDIPSNCAMHLHTRSSLVRCGVNVFSGQFDAGFKTDKMGCFIRVNIPITIYKGARILQALVHTSNEVSNLYNGRYQNK